MTQYISSTQGLTSYWTPNLSWEPWESFGQATPHFFPLPWDYLWRKGEHTTLDSWAVTAARCRSSVKEGGAFLLAPSTVGGWRGCALHMQCRIPKCRQSWAHLRSPCTGTRWLSLAAVGSPGKEAESVCGRHFLRLFLRMLTLVLFKLLASSEWSISIFLFFVSLPR